MRRWLRMLATIGLVSASVFWVGEVAVSAAGPAERLSGEWAEADSSATQDQPATAGSDPRQAAATDAAREAEQAVAEVVTGHELVLDGPKPTIELDELADPSVSFVVRPWTAPSNHGRLRWDITRRVKGRFDAEGIGIPFPQRDVHIHHAGAPA